MKSRRIAFRSLVVGLLIIGAGCSSPAENAPIEEVKLPAHEIHTVEIQQMKFVPDTVIVKKNDRIVFVNRDMVDHDVTEASKREWSSGHLQTDKYWALVATVSQNYYCSLHEVMKGTIVVQ